MHKAVIICIAEVVHRFSVVTGHGSDMHMFKCHTPEAKDKWVGDIFNVIQSLRNTFPNSST